MDIPKGVPKEMREDPGELQEVEARVRLALPPAPSDVGDLWSDKQQKRMRWHAPARRQIGRPVSQKLLRYLRFRPDEQASRYPRIDDREGAPATNFLHLSIELQAQ